MTNTPLVPVFTGTISNQSIQLCNARDLHHFLESRQDFSTWIKNRIEQYGFIQEEDYSINLWNRSDGKPGKGRTEYHLTLDMAKELAMVENNDKGRQIRRYFISLERKSIPDHSAQVAEIEKIFKQQYQKLKKHYNYPRQRLEQPYFTEKQPASLMSMLVNTKEFASQVKALLSEVRTDGHNVDAAWNEYQAMMEALIDASNFLDKTIEMAIKAKMIAASTSLRK